MIVVNALIMTVLVVVGAAATRGVLDAVYDYFDGAFWPCIGVGVVWLLMCGGLLTLAASILGD